VAIDKSRTSPFMKGVIIFFAVLLVLGIGGSSLVPLFEAIFNPGTQTTTGGTTGSTNTSDTIATIAAKYSDKTKSIDASLATEPTNYELLVTQAQAYHDWAGELMQTTQQTGGSDRPLWLLSLDFYKRALAVKPGDPNVTTDMAIVQFYSGDVTGAIATAESVVKAAPTFAPVHFNMGVFFSVSGDNARAIKEYEAYIKLEPKGELVSEANTRITELKSGGTTTP
jgi:tetratricopeptide (TPR) repeat protein